jgi:tRNA dimethylallyltransferase
MKNIPKILVIVGPTASGKTSLSIEIASRFNGEVVSADSRQVYRGLDLGTGKVTQKEMGGIPHHLLDVADPEDVYTVADYVRDGRNAITDIHSRGKLPIIVGGTFFYIDALLGRASTPEVPPNKPLREKLEAMNTEALFALLTEKDPVRAQDIDSQNKRRLVRALEVVDALGSVPETIHESLYDTLTLGITISKKTLYERIYTRILTRIDAGMIEEVASLHRKGLSYTRMDDLGLEYRYIAKYLQGSLQKEEMIELLSTKSRQYAKRQMTWLKRDKDILWVNPSEVENVEIVMEKFINA